MKNKLHLFCLLCLVSIFTNSFAQTISKSWVDGEIYVKYKNYYDISNSVTPQQGNNQNIAPPQPVLPGLDLEFSISFGIYNISTPFKTATDKGLTQILKVQFKNYEQVDNLIKVLSALPYIEYAEQVPYNSFGFQPNDMQVNSTSGQWGLWKINAREAWDISKGDKKIVVAIIDDGVSMFHPDLFDNIWRNPKEIAGNKIDDDNNGYVDDIYGWDVGNNDNNPVQPNVNFTHGTHVGGIAGAVTDNGRGVASIGYNISIMPVKCTFDGQTNVSSIPLGYEGINYAANAGADIINCSWSSAGSSQTGQSVINYALSKGCIIVAAASNDGINQIRYPAAYNGVIAVASTDINDSISSFSNYGTWVDVSAPGSRIRSTIAQGNSYATFDGTSMATPMVAGLLGLIKSHNPNLSNAQLEQCLLDSADDITTINPTYTGLIGKGRINAEKSLKCADTLLKSSPKAQIQSSVSITCPGVEVAFTGSSSSQGQAQNYMWYFPNGTPDTSTQPNPIVSYAGIGSYDVKLVVGNTQGQDSITLKNYIKVDAKGQETLFSADFESGTLSNMGFTVVNPDNSTTWSLENVMGDGSVTKALSLNFFNYSAVGERDALITPVIDLSQNANAVLSFQHAYRTRSATKRDSLLIYASIDSGKTFPYKIAALAETGNFNFITNAGGNLPSAFSPANATDWCYSTLGGAPCAAIDLSDFDGEKAFALKFESYNDAGNNLYIDNISVTAFCSGYNTQKPKAAFTNNDTSFCLPSVIQFASNSENFPTSYQWIFEGGTPNTSTTKNPQVSYNTPGVYDVTLITSNSFGFDTLSLKKYITAEGAPSVNVLADKTTLCRGDNTKLYASGADDYFWSPVFAISSTSGDSVVINPPSSVTYSVRGTSANGCIDTKTIAITVLPGPSISTISRVGDTLIANNAEPSVTFVWQFNGADISVGANANKYRPYLQGNYRVRVTDTLGCQNYSSNYFLSTVGIAGVNETAIKIYPNPAHHKITIEGLQKNQPSTIVITDILGRVAYTTQTQENLYTIDVSALQAGLYFVAIAQNGANSTQKILIE